MSRLLFFVAKSAEFAEIGRPELSRRRCRHGRLEPTSNQKNIVTLFKRRVGHEIETYPTADASLGKWKAVRPIGDVLTAQRQAADQVLALQCARPLLLTRHSPGDKRKAGLIARLWTLHAGSAVISALGPSCSRPKLPEPKQLPGEPGGHASH